MEIFYKTKPDTPERTKEILLIMKRDYYFLVSQKAHKKLSFKPTKENPKFTFAFDTKITGLKRDILALEKEIQNESK